MTATDELRKLLDERGVEWVASGTDTCWTSADGYPIRAWETTNRTHMRVADLTPEQAIAATLGYKVNGETSDGYHTFNELYHHRAVLFSVIVENYRDAAWKAKKHHDGTMYDGMFIVGIDTPWGQASYHYDLDPYWDMFDCEEREAAPEWDGHTPDDAIERIGKLATLGGNGYKQAAAYWKRMFEELLTERIGEERDEAATLGCGMLTAEQVRETVEKHWHDLSADYDMPEATALPEYSFDWQAIADELNAALKNEGEQ